jgi:hypothetical protein
MVFTGHIYSKAKIGVGTLLNATSLADVIRRKTVDTRQNSREGGVDGIQNGGKKHVQRRDAACSASSAAQLHTVLYLFFF